MGLSQTQFASQVLKGARVTLAQYESTKVPTSKLLIKLENIAKREKERCQQAKDKAKYLKFRMLQQMFLFLRFAELKERADVDCKFFPATEEHDAGGFAFLRVRGTDEMMSLQTLLALWDALRLDDSTKEHTSARQAAAQGIKNLNEVLQKINPAAYETQRNFTEGLSLIPQLTITRRPKATT